jgi:hypothetical protein
MTANSGSADSADQSHEEARAPAVGGIDRAHHGLSPLLLQREVAELFRCSPRTIRNWTGRGLLHPIHIGRRTFYSREEIERLSKIGATN